MSDGYGSTRYHIEYRDRPKSLPESVHLAAETANFKHLDKFVKQGLAEGHAESVTLQGREEVLGLMPVHVAAESGRVEVVEYLKKKHVDLGDKFGVTAMHLAAIGNHTGVVKLLLDARCAASPADTQGDHPMHWAATKGHVEVMKVLLSRGAILDSPNKTGWTPLHRAAYNGRKEAIDFLVKSGAKMGARNKDGSTPLHLAVITNQLGAMEDILNNARKTPGDLCINDAEREVLMQYNWKKLILGADVDKKADEASADNGEDAIAPAPVREDAAAPAPVQGDAASPAPVCSHVSLFPCIPVFIPFTSTHREDAAAPALLQGGCRCPHSCPGSMPLPRLLSRLREGEHAAAPAPVHVESRTPRRPVVPDEGFPDALPSPAKDSSKPSAAEQENWTADFMQATSREKLDLESSSRNPYASRMTEEDPHGTFARHSSHRPASSERNRLGSDAPPRFGASNGIGSFKKGFGGAPLPPIGSNSFKGGQVKPALHAMATEVWRVSE
eukprot:gene3962-14042_t